MIGNYTKKEIFQYMDANPSIKERVVKKVKNERKTLEKAFMEVCGEDNNFSVW